MSQRWLWTFGLSCFLAIGCAPPPGDDIDSQDSELSSTEVVAEGTKLTVIADRVNLRAAADTDSDVVTVLERGDVVTAVEESGSNGWVHVKDDASHDGWVTNKYVVKPGSSSNATCDESRGQGIAGRYQKALHDSIAFAEGTEDRGEDGYDLQFSYKVMSSCRTHPDQCLRFRGTCSTAAGRYQMLTDTWNIVKNAKDLENFEPENQERGAIYLIGNVRRVTVPQTRAMTASEFSNALSKLSYEWASLPPGRHGQPIKTAAQMRTAYCSRAGGC